MNGSIEIGPEYLLCCCCLSFLLHSERIIFTNNIHVFNSIGTQATRNDKCLIEFLQSVKNFGHCHFLMVLQSDVFS